MSRLQSYSSVIGSQTRGLTPEEINELPLGEVPSGLESLESCSDGCFVEKFVEDIDSLYAGADELGDAKLYECSICLCEVQPGDSVRCLPSCGHTFHRACIDLWLLR